MKKTILILTLMSILNLGNAQTTESINSNTISDYLSSVSSNQLKSALGLDLETQTYTKVLDSLFSIWKNTFSEANTDIGQIVVKLYDNMKYVLQGLSFDIKTEKFADGLVLKTWINYPYQQGFKKLSIDYFLRKEGNFWKVYDLQIGGLNVFPLYNIVNK